LLAGLVSIETRTNSRKKLAQALNDLLFAVLNLPKQLLHTFMHDLLSQHVELEQLSDEFDQIQTLPHGLCAA
jgi:hypothetical protein